MFQRNFGTQWIFRSFLRSMYLFVCFAIEQCKCEMKPKWLAKISRLIVKQTNLLAIWHSLSLVIYEEKNREREEKKLQTCSIWFHLRSSCKILYGRTRSYSHKTIEGWRIFRTQSWIELAHCTHTHTQINLHQYKYIFRRNKTAKQFHINLQKLSHKLVTWYL